MRRSRKVLLVLTSAAVIPVLMVVGAHTVKHGPAAHQEDGPEKMVSYLKDLMPDMPEERLREIATAAYRDDTIENIANYLKEQTPGMSEDRLREIANYVYTESRERDLDYRLVLAVMKVESNFKENAVSSKGARGLLQIKPSLGRGIAEALGIAWSGDGTLHEPGKNIKFGVYHLSQLIENFDTLQWALFAYNSGSTRARELSAQHKQPGLRFAKAVLQEYEKTITALPDPADDDQLPVAGKQ